MWYNASSILELQVPVSTPFIVMLRPRSGDNQWIANEEYIVSPHVPIIQYTDLYNNLCQRLIAPPGRFVISTSVIAKTPEFSDIGTGMPFIEVQNLPTEVLPYLLPSRYCESDRFTDMAASLTAGYYAGYDQCQAISDYIHDNIKYTPGEQNHLISATEVHQAGHGVCRDLAHLGIAICRALSIPARMVVGYLEDLEPMDMHAWFEAYVGNRWYTFDPTESHLNGGRIAIGYGRDAADVAIYTQFGNPVEVISHEVSIKRNTNQF